MNAPYVEFVNRQPSPSGKTFQWHVVTKGARQTLGHVRWYSKWRCYAFFASPGTLFEKDCLRVIADFCEAQTDQVKSTWKGAKNVDTAAR